MDGFDDLLAPSRSALEDNPFADDAFTRRSSSPDPWASPFAAVEANSNAFESPTSSSEPYKPSDPYTSTTFDEDSSTVTKKTPSEDPLESTNLAVSNDDDDDEPLGRLRSPGFRESIAQNFSETATIRPTVIEEDILPSYSPDPYGQPTPTRNVDTAAPSTIQAQIAKQHSSLGSNDLSPSPSNYDFSSSLDQRSPIGLEHSIAGLPLGGEALGGWHSEQSSWRNDDSTPSVGFIAKPLTEDDSDDDKPISQTLKFPEHEEGKSIQRTTRDVNSLQPVFIITVDDPQKVGDPIRSFTMYTVHTRTTSPMFQKSAFSVLRRYSDFLWLYETLSNNNPGVVVPPVPEKNTFGRFDDQFVRQRRMALEKCIQKIANHPILGKDTDLKLFLESDTFSLDIKHRKAELANERGGLIASIGQTISGTRFHETDEWFDRQKVYLDSLESQLRGLVKAIEFVSKHRQDLATATGEFAQSVGELSSSDVGKQLAQSLAGLADIERKAQDLQNIQSDQDMVTLMATVDEYARLINSVRLAFISRIRTFHLWKNAESDLLRTKQTHEKQRAQGKIPTDRLGHSLSQIAEAERRALEARHEYDHVSKLVKIEVARFEEERVEDFKNSLHAFLEGMISRQKELIAGWENYQQMLLKKLGGQVARPAVADSIAAS